MHLVLVVILLFGALLDDMIFACPARMIPGHARISICVPKVPAGFRQGSSEAKDC